MAKKKYTLYLPVPLARKLDLVARERHGAKSALVEARVERKGAVSVERRSYISSRPLSAEAFADAVRSHWEIENSLHWVLDVTFKEDLSRLRAGHGAANMAVVRHFALNLVRQAKDKRAIKRRRKMASWDPMYLAEILGAAAR
jgi:predicted transposase YbfD/YdcC